MKIINQCLVLSFLLSASSAFGTGRTYSSFEGSFSQEFWAKTPTPLELLGIERSAEKKALAACQAEAAGESIICYIKTVTATECSSIQDDYSEGMDCFAKALAVEASNQ